MKNKTITLINIAIGLFLFTSIAWLLPGKLFSQQAAFAFATLILMVYWWITKPVHLAVTALIPIIVTSLFNIAPMATVLDDYASPIVVLLMGANLLTLTWTLWELDKRIALKILTLIGVSVRQQLIVWFVLATLLSTVLPNAVVAATLCPIALAMIKHCSQADHSIKNSNIKSWILLAIVWGAGLGGFGTPLGGAMNLVAISNIESLLETEYMYFTWIKDMFSYLIILALVICAYFILVKLPVNQLPGSKEYFKKAQQEMKKMNKSERTAIILFTLALLLAFIRPLYANLLPEFKPPYAFLLMGMFAFFLKGNDSQPLMTWDYAVKHLNWGLMILFSGGLAAGKLLVSTGATDSIAEAVLQFNITGQLGLVIIFVGLGMFLSNTSSNTAACAALIPVVIGIVSTLQYDPLPYIYISAAACNCAFALPTSIRAIPVTYGMDTKFMLNKGLSAIALTFASLVIVGYIFIRIY